MRIYPEKNYGRTGIIVCCICLLLCLSACGNGGRADEPMEQVPTPPPTPTPRTVLIQSQQETPTPTATPIPTPQPKNQPNTQPASAGSGRPVLAFYYMWYNTSSWDPTKMWDVPTIKYDSADDATIDRQVNWAANAGITGFISSWWGPGDQTDKNFVKLLAHSASLDSKTHYHFASSIYFECDAGGLSGTDNIITGLHYLISNYSSSPYFFHWQGKPVFFFWDPLGNGRTLAQWASIRSQVDPNNQTIWSAEGVSTDLLSVFDGIHLFSAGYWGIQNNDMPAVDQGFRAKIDAYNGAHGTSKIWAAGVLPGYDDTRVPGRTGTYIVPRNNGATYTTSWNAAMASKPEWITITSFNEWFEGAMIEPGTTYDMQYLNLTQQFTRQWHG